MFTFKDYQELLSERLAFIPNVNGDGGYIHYQDLVSHQLHPHPKYISQNTSYRWVGEKIDRLIFTSKCDSNWVDTNSRVYIGHDLENKIKTIREPQGHIYHASIKGTANVKNNLQSGTDSYEGNDFSNVNAGTSFSKGNAHYKEKEFTTMDIDNYQLLIQKSVSEFVSKINNLRTYDAIIFPDSRSKNAQDIAVELQKQLTGSQQILVASKQNITLAALNSILDIKQFTQDCIDSVTQPSSLNISDFEKSIQNVLQNWVDRASQNNIHFSVGTHFRVPTGTLVKQIVNNYNENFHNLPVQLKTKLSTEFHLAKYINGSLFDVNQLQTSLQNLNTTNRVLFVDDNVTEGSMFTTLFNHLPLELKNKFDFFFLIVERTLCNTWTKIKK